jgi:hypothetical protein
MKEYALLLGKERSIVGIITENDTFDPMRKRKMGAVLLNAGLIHHIGPNRIYVKLARQIAALSIVAMRFDLSGIGDSRPRSDSLPSEDAAIMEVREAMDYLQRAKGVDNIILISICASSPLAFMVTEVDTRVIGCILVNPMVPRINLAIQMDSQQYYWNQALFNKASWVRIFRLKANFKNVWQSTYSRILSKFFSKHHNLESMQIAERLAAIFNAFKARNTKVMAIYSENEIGLKLLKKLIGKKFFELEQAGIIKTAHLAATDHNVTSIQSQQELLAHVMEWIKTLR